ncbi:MAG: hypothetical protein WDO73_00840 [Ignavibacteriota bacterium]
MVHGYQAKWLALYNRLTQPTFSVGEYDWDKHPQQRGWMWETATNPSVANPDHLKTSSSVFDFTSQFSLKSINSGNYNRTLWFRQRHRDGGRYHRRIAVEESCRDLPGEPRHRYRTNDDGTPQQGHQFDRSPTIGRWSRPMRRS